MYAVVDIAGQQFKVTENKKYYVPRLKAEENSEIVFDRVLLLTDGKTTKIGNPVLEGVKVTAKVLAHLKDDKVIVFKKKRRISYKKTRGHRQHLTRIEITKIS
ncbi:MAG: 50S ribosomal protein L21 [Ignavibacterium sp.]|nr:50S ribosomal protein L21 [Ignavibacterium sp.]MCX7611816.1 50S ribosomal protein L21 [Ignavibacterium sp.]MDW8374409.1 50S ribosomal protein L21 [Ignavibacteriales bacterium]